jgi:hypothetical protein
MAESIIGLSEPFFIKVLKLLETEAPDSQHLSKLQQQLTADIQAIQQTVNSGKAGISAGEWETVKRVLVYWADEVLTRHIRDWDDFTLEQEYFGEQNRAWTWHWFSGLKEISLMPSGMSSGRNYPAVTRMLPLPANTGLRSYSGAFAMRLREISRVSH